jgi:hypothetical protein
MMALPWPAFVLQRRINAPLATLEDLVCDHDRIDAGAPIALADAGLSAEFESRFGLVFPPFGVECTSWRATVAGRDAWRTEQLEVELNIWSRGATELLVRPVSTRPHRWGDRRTARYFRVAHASADALTVMFDRHARQVAHAAAARARYEAMVEQNRWPGAVFRP